MKKLIIPLVLIMGVLLVIANYQDIYEKVVVASKRTRQIIDSRMDMFDAFNEEIEDSEELEDLDEDVDYDLDTVLMVSY